MGDEGGATEQWEEEVRFNEWGWDHVTAIGNISMGIVTSHHYTNKICM